MREARYGYKDYVGDENENEKGLDRRRCLPPEFFHTVETDHAFNVLHPTLRCCYTRSLKHGGLREGGDGCLGEVTPLCRWGIEPKRPGRVEGVLIWPSMSAVDRMKEKAYFDIEIGGITEDGANALCLCLHIYFLYFAGLYVGLV